MPRLISFFFLISFFLLRPALAQGQTSLGQLAASMEPGTWSSLTTSNINGTLGASGASGNIVGYADDMVWDRGSRQAYFIGGDHNDLAQFVRYTESTNTWQRLSRPAWFPGSTMHGYNHNAINEAAGEIYHRPFARNLVHRYNISSDTWTTLTPPFASENPPCCDAIEYFPEMGGLVWVRGWGDVWLFNESTDQWSQLGTLPGGNTWQIAEYNPVHKVLVFALSSRLYKLASTGQITQLQNIPINIYDGTGQNGVFTVDPVSGDYLVLTATNRQFYTYNVLTDAWQLRPNQPSAGIGGLTNTHMVATPVSTYGINLFAYCPGRNNCFVMVYKHSPTLPGDLVPPAAPAALQSR